MITFSKWLISEGMGAKEYDPSKLDEKTLLYDFYTLGIYMGRSPTLGSAREKDLLFNIKHAWDKLIPYLRNHLLEKVMNSLLSEMKHFRLDPDDMDSMMSRMGDGARQDFYKWLSDFTDYQHDFHMGLTGGALGFDPKAWGAPTFDEFARFVPLLEKFFKMSAYWPSSAYGGPAWAKIAHAWMKLYSNPNSSVWIDHIYDLQHNTGKALDKNPEYQGYWMDTALSHKRDAQNVFELARHASPFVRTVARRMNLADERKGEDAYPATEDPYRDDSNYGMFYDLGGGEEEVKPEVDVWPLRQEVKKVLDIFHYMRIDTAPIAQNLIALDTFLTTGGLDPVQFDSSGSEGKESDLCQTINQYSSMISASEPGSHFRKSLWEKFLWFGTRYLGIAKKYVDPNNSAFLKQQSSDLVNAIWRLMGRYMQVDPGKKTAESSNLSKLYTFLVYGGHTVTLDKPGFFATKVQDLTTRLTTLKAEGQEGSPHYARAMAEFLHLTNAYVESLKVSVGMVQTPPTSQDDPMDGYYLRPGDSPEVQKLKLQAMSDIAATGKVDPKVQSLLAQHQQAKEVF